MLVHVGRSKSIPEYVENLVRRSAIRGGIEFGEYPAKPGPGKHKKDVAILECHVFFY